MRLAVAVIGLGLIAVPASADLFTVGPGGTHATIQGAIDTALARGGSHEIRVVPGRWRERLRIAAGSPDALRLSGGWNPGFSIQSAGPESTIIDGGGQAPVVEVRLEGGELTLKRFTITGGDRPSEGPAGFPVPGAVNAHLQLGARLELSENAIRDNHVRGATDVSAAGLHCFAVDSSVILRDNAFVGNSVEATDALGRAELAAGLVGAGSASSEFRSQVVVVGNRFAENEAVGLVGDQSSVFYLGVQGRMRGEFSDNRVAGNVVRAENPAGSPVVHLFVGEYGGVGEPLVTARRNAFQDNVSGHADSPHLMVTLRGGRVDLTDSLFARGDGGGLRLGAWKGASGRPGILHATNLTVTGHPGYGLDRTPGDGEVLVSNTILYGNGVDLVGGAVVDTANLVATDPRFLDPARDYRLRIGSPGIDGGDTAAPGGLGPLDILEARRVQGGSVDVGAYEASAGGSGSSGGACRALWPLAGGPSVDRYAPACRCASDVSLRSLRCAFFGEEIFAVLRTPLIPPGARPFEAEWTLHAWEPVVGPYDMDAALLVKDEWLEQPWLGPSAKTLGEGRLVVEPFLFEAPSREPTWLRTRLRYRPRGQGEPVELQLEVLLSAARGGDDPIPPPQAGKR